MFSAAWHRKGLSGLNIKQLCIGNGLETGLTRPDTEAIFHYKDLLSWVSIH